MEDISCVVEICPKDWAELLLLLMLHGGYFVCCRDMSEGFGIAVVVVDDVVIFIIFVWCRDMSEGFVGLLLLLLLILLLLVLLLLLLLLLMLLIFCVL